MYKLAGNSRVAQPKKGEKFMKRAPQLGLIAVIIIAVAVLFFYPLSKKKMIEIETELKTRKEKEDSE